MRIDVISIFPEYLDPLRHALLGKAIEQGILQVGVHNLRQWTSDVHQSVDSTPYGGGPGMVMKPQVWGPALDDVAAGAGPAASAKDLESATLHRGTVKSTFDVETGGDSDVTNSDDCDNSADSIGSRETNLDGERSHDRRPLLVVPTPAGKPFTQQMAADWSVEEHLVFACGRYEGIDQRVVEDAKNTYRVEEVSIGDYVLIGGEVAVLVMVEAVVRLIPGVLGNKASHEEDSFQDGLLEGPSYTKPRQWRGLEVPEVLLSGNHALVDRWRRDQALLRTAERRPELIAELEASGELSPADKAVLAELGSQP